MEAKYKYGNYFYVFPTVKRCIYRLYPILYKVEFPNTNYPLDSQNPKEAERSPIKVSLFDRMTPSYVISHMKFNKIKSKCAKWTTYILNEAIIIDFIHLPDELTGRLSQSLVK